GRPSEDWRPCCRARRLSKDRGRFDGAKGLACARSTNGGSAGILSLGLVGMSRKFSVVIVMLALGLAGCDLAGAVDSLLPERPKPPLPGKRVSVLNLERQIQPDPSIQEVDVRLPQPVVNPSWPEAGGYPTHAMHHLALGERVREAWSRSFGAGNSRSGQVLAAPVIENGRIVTMDAESVVTAFDAANGRRLWKFDTQPKKSNTTTFGGGV